MTRDFTRAQFAAALKRNGFAPDAHGFFIDTTGETPGKTFGVHRLDGSCARRATVAHLIKSRARWARHATRRQSVVASQPQPETSQ